MEEIDLIKRTIQQPCTTDDCSNRGTYMISFCGDERWACYEHHRNYIVIMHVSVSMPQYRKRRHFYKDRIGTFGYLPRPGARTIVGITYGPEELAFVKELGNGYEIWKSFGHTGWASIGETTYAPGSYMLVKAEDDMIVDFVHVTPGRFWKRGIEFLEEYYGNLILCQ